MESISEARLKYVHPELARRARALSDTLTQEHIYIRVVQGFRTVFEQDELYAKGRTRVSDIACVHDGRPRPPGTCVIHPLGATVTNCPGGHSYHNYGLAVDCDPSLNGPGMAFVPDWNESHPTWARMERAGVSLGLDSGALWRSIHDAPHFQLTGKLPEGHPPESALIAYKAGGLAAVWEMAGLPV